MKILNLILLILAILTALFLFWGFSSLLDFFPWGDSKAYVIWEPLLLYFIVPTFVIVGLILILVGKRTITTGVYILMAGLSFLLPSILGFDLDTDLSGRWSGVIVPFLATIFFIKYFIKIWQH